MNAAAPSAGRTEAGAGYRHPDFGRSFASFATPVALPGAGGSLLLRGIPGTGLRDAAGPYPLLACGRYDALAADLRALPADVIAVSAVVDPFADADAALDAAFDFRRPYKPHHVADLAVPFTAYLRRHHRRYAARGLAAVDVERAADPAVHVDEWSALYGAFCDARGIGGLRALDDEGRRRQLGVPGAHYFRALAGGDCVGALVCLFDREVAYAHLIATTPDGQAKLAQYALYWHAIEYFRGRARWFNLGATPDGAAAGGLAFFKAGWATGARPSWFCGLIRDRARYDAIPVAVPDVGFFPAYRGPTGF